MCVVIVNGTKSRKGARSVEYVSIHIEIARYSDRAIITELQETTTLVSQPKLAEGTLRDLMFVREEPSNHDTARRVAVM
jgi:hypothetical protein